jgi:hypothetical protein
VQYPHWRQTSIIIPAKSLQAKVLAGVLSRPYPGSSLCAADKGAEEELKK